MTLGVPPVELAAGDEAIIADTDESGKGPSACQAQFWKKETKPPKVETVSDRLKWSVSDRRRAIRPRTRQKWTQSSVADCSELYLASGVHWIIPDRAKSPRRTGKGDLWMWLAGENAVSISLTPESLSRIKLHLLAVFIYQCELVKDCTIVSDNRGKINCSKERTLLFVSFLRNTRKGEQEEDQELPFGSRQYRRADKCHRGKIALTNLLTVPTGGSPSVVDFRR
ncbi:hypothetical protein T01_1811 [Trichinella spiralis]|uniref:Uncharacterized protein n=1 Tax=Trichinella spiralis TaxID=6334 RepID=A0A0V1B5X7_TRISP|nr:hypothetical protein T01_1811 [Trichinella spiralis]